MNFLSVAEPSLCSQAMLCSLSISMWSARKHDRGPSQEIAQRHAARTAKKLAPSMAEELSLVFLHELCDLVVKTG